MRIIVTTGRKECCVEYQNDWYQVESESELALALSVLPIKVERAFNAVEQAVCRGTASLALESDSSVRFTLTPHAGPEEKLSVVMPIDEQCLCSVEWQHKPHSDKWLGCRNVVTLDAVGSYAVKVFIPEISGQGDKRLLVKNVTTGAESGVDMIRGQENLVQITDQPAEARQVIELTCESEPSTDSRETRELGFVLVDELVSAA